MLERSELFSSVKYPPALLQSYTLESGLGINLRLGLCLGSGLDFCPYCSPVLIEETAT